MSLWPHGRRCEVRSIRPFAVYADDDVGASFISTNSSLRSHGITRLHMQSRNRVHTHMPYTRVHILTHTHTHMRTACAERSNWFLWGPSSAFVFVCVCSKRARVYSHKHALTHMHTYAQAHRMCAYAYAADPQLGCCICSESESCVCVPLRVEN